MKIEELIERVKAGDADALRTVYEVYSQRMRNACKRMTQEDEDTVSDLVQESFIRAYYSLGKLKDASKFGEWIIAITKNVSLRYLERKRKIQMVSFSAIEDGLDVESSYASDSKLEEKELLEIIDQLPSGYRKVFRMAVIDGFSHKEIAEKLGIEPHSSSSQLTRAKVLLRNMINRRMLAIISIVLISIPICKYLFWKKGTEKEQLSVAKVSNGKKKHPVNPETEQPNTPLAVIKQPNAPLSVTNKSLMATASQRKMELPNYAVVDSVDIKTDSEKKDSTNNILVAIEKDTMSLDTIKQVAPKLEEFIAKEANPSHKNKWQLLAMGSLGSALAQNAYKLIAGNSSGLPDPDGPTPIVPDVFSTWGDYYNYLQQKKHDGMPADTVALMTIAKHNSGKIIEHEHHEKPITLGISLTKTIGKNWNMETGLQYSLLKSNFILGEGEYHISRDQKVHYLGIPVRTSYKWFNSKKWSAYSSAGVLLNIPMYGKNSVQYVTGTTVPYKDSWHFTPSAQWTVGVGTGLQYNFTPKWSLYLEPSFNWYIPNGSSVHTIWTEHPFTVTVPFGIRFTW